MSDIETKENNWTRKEVPRLHEIVGNECAKRALEVALDGGHCFALIAAPGAPASDLLWAAHRVAAECGLSFKGYVVSQCPCGALGDPRVECNCTNAAIEKHRRTTRGKTRDAVMFIETVRPRARETAKGNEAEGAMVIRILQAKGAPEPELMQDGEELLRMAMTELGGCVDRAKSLAVAKTVARLGLSPYIGAQHISEAIQYVRNPFGDVDGFEVAETKR